jgi:transcription elongation factor Elf1
MESPRFIIETEHVLGRMLQREYTCPLCEKLKNGLTSLCTQSRKGWAEALTAAACGRRALASILGCRRSVFDASSEQATCDLEFRFIVATYPRPQDLCLT